jgi:hypothetical protein
MRAGGLRLVMKQYSLRVAIYSAKYKDANTLSSWFVLCNIHIFSVGAYKRGMSCRQRIGIIRIVLIVIIMRIISYAMMVSRKLQPVTYLYTAMCIIMIMLRRI